MKKIKKIQTKIINNIKLLIHFGFLCSFYDFFDSIIFREKGKLGKYFHHKKYNYVKKYIKNKYNDIIENYKNIDNEINYIDEKCPIFIFWWQGMDDAPEIVKACLNSVKRHVGNHQINIIDKNNFRKYIDIPNYILENFNKGKISITHLSDVLRFNLLYKYGGIWIDATVYLTQDFDKELYNHRFYTVRHNKHKSYHVCKGLWTTSLIASGKNNQLMKFMKELLSEYLKDNEIFISYLLIDALLAIAYENIEVFNKEIENVPINNTNFFELEKNLSNEYVLEELEKYKNTYIFKTTYRTQFLKKINNCSTFYNEILSGNI